MRHRISRRTMLRGLGTAVALPWLEAMTAGRVSAASASSGAPPRRMAFLFVPNGMHMPDFTPDDEGPLEKLPPILKPLEAFRSQISVLSGLALDGGRAQGDGPGDHARCVASFLTAAHPRKTNGKDIRAGISIDQVAAAAIGGQTRFPSLELGCEPSAQSGRCDSGYSCVYTSNMSWRTATSPMTKEINPQAVFDRLFGAGSAGQQSAAKALRDQRRRSVLDLVAEDAGELRRKLGGPDRRKLDEYLYAVRQIEQRAADAEKLTGTEADASNFPRPAGVPREFADHVALMMDMMVLAWQTDSTRILTFMYTNAGSNRNYPNIDVRSGHHQLSHHGNDPKKQADISKINRFHVGLLAHFLGRLADVNEAGGTLLDQAMIVYGSGLGDGNRHNHDNLPILLGGGGAGTLRQGRHLRYDFNTPLANLYLAMLERMGVRRKAFADSSGPLEGLA